MISFMRVILFAETAALGSHPRAVEAERPVALGMGGARGIVTVTRDRVREGESITMSSRYWLTFAGALAALPAAAQAHHSFAAFFDPAKSVTVTGTVTEFRFTNPHGMIALDVRKPGGGVEQWRAETNAPVVLVQRGWNRDSIKPGMVVTIDGWPSRDGRNYMRMRAVKDANGKPIGTAPFDEKAQS
jgi:hypothetical protein